ncbi:Putative aminoacrylate hydrolase RutD [Malassezia restricta CBS 7877]|uniref:Aminoacrylate hydrolase RutD n=1 Tax=Malassezia restricta (strain ATCC 96810 / NBRC 103918 / CBS 7877) TaxID=425264 RepID=A0A3G2S7A8_MALR7|nr:Putative aminoacrylate hydrolase RutD [Malassezia restricta CBS 7877]
MAPHLCRMPDGARIGYRVLGGEHAQGPTLVMVNGMSAVMDDWMELAVPLARTRQVVLFDHRGLGASHGTGDEDVTIELMAHDVLRLCQALHLRVVHLLGFSMGGLVAQAILSHPDAQPTPDEAGVVIHGIEVRRVILAATFTKSPRTEFRLDGAAIPDDATRAERAMAQLQYMLAMQYHPAVLGEGRPMQHKMDARMRRGLAARRPLNTMARQAVAIAIYQGRDRLRYVPRHLPIAILHGRYDHMVAYDEAREIERFLPQARRLFPHVDGDREAYGHLWFDYFDVDTAWLPPLVHFLDRPATARM